MSLSRPRILVLLCTALGALLLGISASPLTLPPERIEPRVWRGYYTLQVESAESVEALVLRLAESGRFRAVVSAYTSEVSFNTFSGFDSVAIHSLSDRLDSLDPRFDPYMQRIGALFSVGGSWEAVYLRTDRNHLSTYLHLRQVFAGRGLRWRLIEFDPPRVFLKLLLLVSYLAVCIRLGSSGAIRLAVLLASLPWLFPVAVSRFAVLLAFFLWLPSLLHFLERLYTYRYIRSREGGARAAFGGPAAVLAAAAAGAVLLRIPGPLTGLLMAMAGGPAAAVFLYFSIRLREESQAHRPFLALPILRRLRPRRRVPLAREAALHLLAAFIVLVSYPALQLRTSLRDSSPPVTIRMRSIGTRGLSWSTLAILADSGARSGIPDLADYLTHRAYQETLIFAGPYEFPRPGKRIRISEYRIDPQSARVHKTFRVVKQFKESWLTGTLERARPGSVPRLLADQGYAGVLEVSPASEPVGRTVFSVVLIILFLIQFLIPGHFNLTASALYATRNLTLRRR